MANRPRWRRVLWAIVGVLVLGYLVVFVGLRVYVTPGFLRGQMEHAVALASDGRYTVDFDEISVGWDLSIRILDGRLVPVPGDHHEGRNEYQASFGRFSLEGVHLWQLVRHKRLHLGSVRLRRPGLIVRFAGEGDLPSVLARMEERLGGPAREGTSFGLAFDEIVLLDGRMVLERDQDGVRQTNRIDDVDITIRNLTVAEGTDPLERMDITVSVRSLERTWSDRRQRVAVTDITMASRDSAIAVGRFTMEPPKTDREFFAGLATRKDLVRVTASGIRASGFDMRSLLSVPIYQATNLIADSLTVTVVSDQQIPKAEAGPLPNQPNEQLAGLPTPVRVDSVVVRGGSITYREIPSSGGPEGVVAFDDIAGTIIGVDLQTADPLVATLSANLFGEIPLAATVWLPLTSSTFNLRYTATAGPADVQAVNAATVPLMGVELSRGTVDSVYVEATVVDGDAEGTFEAHWRDLKVQLVKRETGRSNLVKRLGSLAANALVVPGNNPASEGRPPQVGTISYEAAPRDSFFGFLWRSARSGIVSILSDGTS